MTKSSAAHAVNGKGLSRHLTQDDIDKLRHDFAGRLASLIGDSKNEKNLENFSKKSGVGIRQLSQWQNRRHLNWPSAANLIRISRAGGVSIDWLLTGER